MANLVVIVYPDEYRAAEVLTMLQRLQKEALIDMEDAVYVTKNEEGKIKLHQSKSLTGAGALSGGFWGMLVGLLFFMPVGGLIIGAAAGAMAGKLSDYGIDDKFAKQIADEMTPGSSGLFVLVRKSTPDKVLPEISQFGGKVMHTSLTKEAEARIQAALDAGSTPAAPAAPATPAADTPAKS